MFGACPRSRHQGCRGVGAGLCPYRSARGRPDRPHRVPGAALRQRKARNGMTTEQFLSDADARFDPDAGMPWSSATGPGYHTRVPEGTRVHQTREAADYAIALLQCGGADRVARAHQTLEALLDAQITNPLAEHYGIWGWFL